MKNISIIGSGSWGVALGIYLASLGNNIKIWSFAEDERNLINNEKKCKFLPKVTLPDNITALSNYEKVIEDSEIILHVTPSKFVRNTMQEYKKYVKDNQIIIMCSKGFEPGTNLPLDEVIKQELPNNKFGILSGPSHAMRIYSSTDVKGVEIGGALKNIIAFCAGISVGLNLGDNSFAALATRGLVEITRLGTAMGAKEKTFYGLTGLGDLIVTCGSEHSRNRRAGEMIGKGYTIEEAREQIGMTIESVDNIDVAYNLAKQYNIEMPIVNAVYNVLYNGLKPIDAVNNLMTRELKYE